MAHKNMFNSLVAKEEWTVKMVDGSACEVIGTGKLRLQEEMGQYMLWRLSGMSRRHGAI